MIRRMLGATVLVAAMGLGFGAQAANDFEPGLNKVLDDNIGAWLADPAVIEAVKAQNAKNAALDQAAIDALDKQWRAEAKAGGGPMITEVTSNALSQFLVGKAKASDGLFLEIFVMDDKGLNVGQSDVTSDYWQGDEPKWQKSFGAGPGGRLIDEVDFDDSAKAFVSQVSRTIVDPADGHAIGAVTVGVNVEKLP